MSGLSEFNRTVQTSEIWIKEIAEELDVEKRPGLQAFRATVTSLRDRMRVDDATNFGAQLPLLLAGYYYEGWVPSRTPTKERSVDDFVDRVQERLSDLGHDLKAEEVVGAVFKILAEHVSEGSIRSLQKVMPEEFQQLWPARLA